MRDSKKIKKLNQVNHRLLFYHRLEPGLAHRYFCYTGFLSISLLFLPVIWYVYPNLNYIFSSLSLLLVVRSGLTV